MIQFGTGSGTWSGFFGNTNKSVFLGSSSNSGTIWFRDFEDPTLSFPLTIQSGGGTFWHATNGTVTLSQNISLNGTLTAKVEHNAYVAPTLNGSGEITISGTLSGSGGFTSYSTATAGNPITLSAANTYTGTTTINTGELTLGISNALPVSSNAGLIRFGGVAGGTPTLNLGAFNLGSGTDLANSAGALDFDVNSTINLASSGSYNYYFKASDGQTWDAISITINNWKGNPGQSGLFKKIFIGNSASLTPAQLAKITFAGYTGCTQLSTGEIVPIGGFNPGFEAIPIIANGWNITNTSSGTYSISTGRSGSLNAQSVVRTSTAVDKIRHSSGYFVTIPDNGTNYIHVIGWMAVDNVIDASGSVEALTNSSGGTSYTTSVGSTFATESTYQQFSRSGIGTNGAHYFPGFTITASTTASRTYNFDDIVIYTSTSSGADISIPNSPTSPSANLNNGTVQVGWTAGEDNPLNTSGIDGVLILRTEGSGKSAPTALNQRWYSATEPLIGPTSIVNGNDTWTVLSNSNPTSNFIDVTASIGSQYTYAIYMRDKAYNYSFPVTVTFSYCSDPTTMIKTSPIHYD
jgi:autotransporter-associated beta strand protein